MLLGPEHPALPHPSARAQRNTALIVPAPDRTRRVRLSRGCAEDPWQERALLSPTCPDATLSTYWNSLCATLSRNLRACRGQTAGSTAVSLQRNNR